MTTTPTTERAEPEAGVPLHGQRLLIEAKVLDVARQRHLVATRLKRWDREKAASQPNGVVENDLALAFRQANYHLQRKEATLARLWAEYDLMATRSQP